jgi:protease I
MPKLNGKKVAILMTDGVEESELLEPSKALQMEGAEVIVASPEGGEVQVMRHDEKTFKANSQMKTAELRASDFDAVMLPGGTMNGDKLRKDTDARRFVQEMNAGEKPIAAICHAPWLLVSAGLVKDRKLTSFFTLEDDIRNAGGNWVDEETVVDGNLLTSRHPGDLPAFNARMLEMFAGAKAAAGRT